MVKSIVFFESNVVVLVVNFDVVFKFRNVGYGFCEFEVDLSRGDGIGRLFVKGIVCEFVILFLREFFYIVVVSNFGVVRDCGGVGFDFSFLFCGWVCGWCVDGEVVSKELLFILFDGGWKWVVCFEVEEGDVESLLSVRF